MTANIVISQGIHFHSACALVRARARDCLAFVREGRRMSQWLVDQPEVTPLGDHLFAIEYSARLFVRVAPENDNTIYFHVGADPGRLQKRILIAIYEAPENNGAAGGCLVNLMGWRMDDMTGRRWRDLCMRHEKEIKTLRQLLEQPG